MVSKTFIFPEIAPEPLYPVAATPKGYTLSEHLRQELLHEESPVGGVHPWFKNGLSATLAQAYSKHVPLVLRPDDLWSAITSAFANYVITHAEEMRRVFVAHEGQKALTVYGGGWFATADWDGLIGQFGVEIEKHLELKMREWIVPEFTTTTKLDKLVSQVQFMGAMQKYFSYGVCLSCGLSQVTLEGTEEDWVQLRDRAARLPEFGSKDLGLWSDVLLPVLDEFVSAYRGKVNEDFWQRVATSRSYGSGGSTYQGWLTVFSPFSAKGIYQLNSPDGVLKSGAWAYLGDDDIISTLIEVPVHINDNGNAFDTTFFGGLAFPSYDAGTTTLRPGLGWAIRKDS